MKQAFIDKTFSAKSMALIERANGIINSYERQGYRLTLRQLYYRFVAGGHLENTERNYKNLGNTISDARLAGLVDWSAIEDRTRSLATHSSWEGPEEMIQAAYESHRLDMWKMQPWYVEVWVEKEALANVVQRACQERRVPHFSCRGYVSQSEMYEAARRLVRESRLRENVLIIHLGDHDPSGIDMSRDIQDRLSLMMEHGNRQKLKFSRIALNWEQVEQYNPPPNPAKSTDSRFENYFSEYGDESWELDALEPAVLNRLITAEIATVVDEKIWAQDLAQEAEERELLRQTYMKWENVVEFLGTGSEEDADLSG